MFAELKMVLENTDIDFKKSSNLQGLLMENIDTDYAEYLHSLSVNPYSQCLLTENKKKVWCIRTLTDEAYEQIIMPFLKKDEFVLKKGNITLKVIEKKIRTNSIKNLLEEFYRPDCTHIIDLGFQTPTAFKSMGQYVFYPDFRLIYKSLMKKCTALIPELSMNDEDTLEQLVNNTEILRYKLQSIPFPLEGVNVTGFQGTVRIRIKGTHTMARYVKLLLKCGEFSGIGIKTSIGMGAIKILEKGMVRDDG